MKRTHASSCRLAAAIGPLLLAFTGCGEAPAPATPPVSVEADTPEAPAVEPARYVVRGEVVSLPRGDDHLRVFHEEIPHFKSRTGKVVGMSAMTMPFPLGEGVSADGLAPGDKVEITFEVVWTGPQPWYATEIAPLPADTELDLTPNAASPDTHDGHNHDDHAGHNH